MSQTVVTLHFCQDCSICTQRPLTWIQHFTLNLHTAATSTASQHSIYDVIHQHTSLRLKLIFGYTSYSLIYTFLICKI